MSETKTVVKVDAIGEKCPMPVIKAKNALKGIEEGVVEVLVDNEISMENVGKLCVEHNCEYSVVKDGGIYKIIINKSEATKEKKESIEDNTVIVIDSDTMGKGDETLGKTLIKGFIYTLTEIEKLPKSIIFYNKGVNFVAEGSESLEDLEKLSRAGVKIYSCGACVNFYELSGKIKVGEITNMLNIVNIQMKATRIIKP